jgi:hypothetical protein
MNNTPYFTPIRTIELAPTTITERIHGTDFTATIRARLTISRLPDGRLYVHGKTWRNGQLVECYGCGGSGADEIVKRHTGIGIKEAADA